MNIKFVEFGKREADNLDKLDLINQIRSLIHTYHDEKLPLTTRENAFNKLNDLTKKLTS